MCWNATEAARRANYKTPRQAGAHLLSKAVIRDALAARLAEKTMKADEVLLRLADQARGNIAEFIVVANGDVRIDLAKAEAAGKLHLVKRVKQGQFGLEIELHDAQAALVHLGKHLGIFKEMQELDIGDTLARVLERLAGQGGTAND